MGEDPERVVLLLDDDTVWLRTLQRLLERRKVAVRAFSEVEPMLESLDAPLPDVFVIDFLLGGNWNGAKVAEMIRRLAPTAGPLVLLSGTLRQVPVDDRARFDEALEKGGRIMEVVDRIVELAHSSRVTSSHMRLRPVSMDEEPAAKPRRKHFNTPK